jgi:hypothetical protein
MRSIRLLLPLTSLALGVATAAAGVSFTVTVDPSKAGTAEACTSKPATTTDKLDALTVTVVAKQKSNLQLTVDASVVVLKADTADVKFPAAAYLNKSLLVMSSGKKICDRLLEPAVITPPGTPTPGTPDGTSTPPVEVDRSALAVLDQAARTFLESKNITDHQVVKQSNFGRTFRIYHLPTGAPAFPLPRHVNEKDDLEIWTVIPSDATVSVDVSACDKVPAVRVGGTYKAAKEYAGALQSGEKEKITFKLDGYARRLNCAGTLTYKVDVSHKGMAASTTTSVPFDPVYRFEWGVGFMFDFARPHKLSLGDRPTDDGMGKIGSEKFVVDSDDYAGFKPVITLGINVCGTNPEEMTWCDRLLNPTLIVDPTRLTSGFGLGLSFRPFHGFGVLAGMSVFKTTVLADGTMVKVGDPWSIAGDLPTKEVFNKDSLGFMLSAVVSTDVFAALKKSE